MKEYPQRVCYIAQYNYLIAICPTMDALILSSGDTSKEKKECLHYRDCLLHRVMTNLAIELICIPNDSLTSFQILKDKFKSPEIMNSMLKKIEDSKTRFLVNI